MEASPWSGHVIWSYATESVCLWLLYARSNAACHMPTAETLQMDERPQSQLFYLLFDFNSNLREPHNLSPNSLSPLDCPMPYMPCRCCEYKSHPILSHLESLLPNYFSQKAKRTHFLQGGERSWQQTTQAGSCSSLGGVVWSSHRTATKLLHSPVLITSQQAESLYQM